MDDRACDSSDGLNTICFDQNDPGFALGVLAFTRVVSADTIGEQLPSSGAPSTFIGQILDADTLFLPGDPNTTFATPAALPLYPNAYDLESILTHELGHSFGFNHSGAWAAMMFPFAPAPGQITGTRPTPDSPMRRSPTTIARGCASYTQTQQTPCTSARSAAACCLRTARPATAGSARVRARPR